MENKSKYQEWIKKHVENSKRFMKADNMIRNVKPLPAHSDLREGKGKKNED